MSILDLTITSLRSVRSRRLILGTEADVRLISAPETTEAGNLIGNLLSGLWKGIRSIGWIFGNVVFRNGFNFREAFGLLNGIRAFIWNFNWNATDRELDNHINNLKILIASQLGGTLGNLFGWIVCGIVPSAAIAYLNQPLALYLLKEVGEEAFDEFAAEFGALVRLTFNALAQTLMINFYKAARRNIKDFFRNPSSPQNQLMRRIFGSNFDNMVRSWGAEGSKPWSFRRALDDAIDSIENPLLQNFVEEFVEEFGDACIEAGYVIAGGIDDWIFKQKQAKEALLGQERTIELIPDRETEESIIISAPEELAKVQMVEHMALDAVVGARDLGFFVGEPLRNNQRKVKSPITLRIMMFDRQTPPWLSNREDAVRASITIPGIQRSKLDWSRVKEAIGGRNGYLWGRYFATAQLIDDQDNFAGSMKVYAGSEEEASDRLKAVMTLSDYRIAGMTTHEEKREGARATNPRLRKETTRVYPGHMTIINSRKIINQDEGRATLTGTYKKRRDKIPLWYDTKPDDYEERINELLRNL